MTTAYFVVQTVMLILATLPTELPGTARCRPTAPVRPQSPCVTKEGLVVQTVVLAVSPGCKSITEGVGAAPWIATGPTRPPAELTNHAVGYPCRLQPALLLF